jgi:hypothetical protein
MTQVRDERWNTIFMMPNVIRALRKTKYIQCEPEKILGKSNNKVIHTRMLNVSTREAEANMLMFRVGSTRLNPSSQSASSPL